MLYQKIKKHIKKTSKTFLQTIIPHKIPEFCICDSNNPLFYMYFINNDIFYISHRENVAFSEVVIDEIIKVGFENGEFEFYPINAKSSFFKQDYEIDAFRFIQLILSNNLNTIAGEIYAYMEAFERKILEYEAFYKTKLKNVICDVKFIDKHEILMLNEDMKWEIENAIKTHIVEISQENILDSKRHIFEILFKDGIFEMENLRQNLIGWDILKHYYNRSNLADNVEKSLIITLGKMQFFIHYFCDSVFLNANPSGKIFANSVVVLRKISLLGSPKIHYLNNDLKIVFEGEKIHINNLQKMQVILHSIKSTLKLNNAESSVESSEILHINDSIELQNMGILEDLHLHKNSRISHRLELVYSINGEKKRFVGSANVNDLFSDV